MNEKRSYWYKLFASILVAAVLIIVTVRLLDIHELFYTLKNASLKWLVIAFVCLFLFQMFRAIRYDLLISHESNLLKMFSTQCLHSFFNAIFPAGLGEVIFIYLLKKIHRVSLIRGFSTLFVARMLDILFFCTVFFIVIFFSRSMIPALIVWFMIYVSAFILLLVVAIRFMLKTEAKIKLRLKLPVFIIEKANQSIESLKEIRGKGIFTKLAFCSVLMWTAMYLFFCAVVWSLSLYLDWTTILLVYILLFPLEILPIKGIANAGTHEAAWIIALLIVGMDKNDAAVIAFGSHIIFLFIQTLFCLIPAVHFLCISPSKTPLENERRRYRCLKT